MNSGILHTEAVVLRTLNYSETSRIGTLFTRKAGRLGVMAKGARRPRSRVGSCLQPLAYLDVVVHVRPNRELQTLSEASHARLFSNLATNLDRITTGFRIVELLQSLLEDCEQDENIFSLLLRCLELLNSPETPVEHVYPCFQMRLAKALGFEPRFTRESIVQLTEAGGTLQLETGAVNTPSRLAESLRHGSRAALRAFAIYSRANFRGIQSMHLSEAEQTEVNSLIKDYFRFHTERNYPARSTRVLDQLQP